VLDRGFPRTDAANGCAFNVPWFKHYRPEILEEYADAIKKAVMNYQELFKR